jgi:hypothetical protein
LANAAVVYDRDIEDSIYTFEASGGLVHATLVMQDRETNSHWSIMTNESIHGKKKGTKLNELPLGVKTQWKNWKENYPNTLVLSVKDKEDSKNVYSNYFNSDGVFRGHYATDKRMEDKVPVFAFHYKDKNYAIPHSRVEDGKIVKVEDEFFFMFRPEKSSIYQSTAAYNLENRQIEINNNKWVISDTNCYFNSKSYHFVGEGSDCPPKLEGMDTFWYTWSLTNPGTIILQ